MTPPKEPSGPNSHLNDGREPIHESIPDSSVNYRYRPAEDFRVIPEWPSRHSPGPAREEISSHASSIDVSESRSDAELSRSDRSRGGAEPPTRLATSSAASSDHPPYDDPILESLLEPELSNSDLDSLEQRVLDCLDFTAPKYWFRGPSKHLHSLQDYERELGLVVDALDLLQNEGFIQERFCIFLQDEARPNVAKALWIWVKDVRHLLKSLTDALDAIPGSGSQSLRRSLEEIRLGIGLPLAAKPTSAWLDDLLGSYSWMYDILVYGVITYVNSHVAPVLDTYYHLSEDILVGGGYSLCQVDLACLSDFIQGPVWIFRSFREEGEGEETRRKMVLSMTIDQFNDLWGPLTFVHGSERLIAIRTDRGVIHATSTAAVPCSPDEREVPCHWSNWSLIHRGLDRYALPSGTCDIDLSKGRLLIGGALESSEINLERNAECMADMGTLQAIMNNNGLLQFPGTSESYHGPDGYELNASVGYYATVSVTKKLKRFPGRTHKSALVAYLDRPLTELRLSSIISLLNLRVGLEVSACTGNARRVTLWEALRLSRYKTFTGRLSKHCDCLHSVGDVSCLLSCWNEEEFSTLLQEDLISDHSSDLSLDGPRLKFSKSRPKELQDKLALMDAVRPALRDLELTGVDSNKDLQIWWPFASTPTTARFPQSDKRQARRWIPLVQDTKDIATFAVFSDNCLEFKTSGYAALEAMGPRSCRAERQDQAFSKSVLLTYVQQLPSSRTKEGAQDEPKDIKEQISNDPRGTLKIKLGESHTLRIWSVELQDRAIYVGNVDSKSAASAAWHSIAGKVISASTLAYREQLRSDCKTEGHIPLFVR